MASSSPPASPSGYTQLLPLSDAQSSFSSVVYDLSQQVQSAMENMLKMITEIDQSSSGITEEIEKCKESALERKKFRGRQRPFPKSSLLGFRHAEQQRVTKGQNPE